MNLPELNQLAGLVHAGAEKILLSSFGLQSYEYKKDGSIVTQADHDMQCYLFDHLRGAWPYDVLGEEMSTEDQHLILNNETYWCVDPIDGTSNFAHGLPFFAVSVALIHKQQTVLGLIYDPVRRETFSAIKGGGAWLNNKSLSTIETVDRDSVIAEIDFKRLPKDLAKRLVADGPFDSQRNIGSSALDWCWLAARRYDIYLHGGQKLWDYAAGHLIVTEAGGDSVTLDGDQVFRGLLETRSVLASMNTQVLNQWRTFLNIPSD